MKRTRDRINHPYVGRLILWIVVLNSSLIALHLIPDSVMIWRDGNAHALIEACCALVSGGVAYCFWVQYRVSTGRRMLLASVAFCGLMFAQLVHAFTSAIGFAGWSHAQSIGNYFYDLWKLVACSFLVAAARNNSTDSKAMCRRIGMRMMWGTLAVSVLVCLIVLLAGRVHTQHVRLSVSDSALLKYVLWLTSSYMLAHAAGLAIMTLSLGVFVWRYVEEEDAFSDGIVRCMVLALSGMVALLASDRPFDLSWWVSHVMTMCGLLVLLIELAREFGASYANAQTRVDHLEAVHRISSQLGTTLDLRVVLLVLVSDIADLLQARHASVMLVDDTGETLRTVATHGLPDSPLKPCEPQRIEGGGRPGFYSGHTARAFREKRICMVDDVFTDVEFIPWKVLAQCNGYAVSVPLIYQDVALGVMNLFFDTHIPINDERLRLFETLASASSVAIANAQLYDRALEAHPDESDTANLFRMRLAA